jgi:PAS domain S-box-containing protein
MKREKKISAPGSRSSARSLVNLFDGPNQSELELRQACLYAQAIIEAVPPLLILDANLRVKMANESFYKHFRVAPPQTENCLVYELGNGQWDIPKLRTFLEEVLPRHSVFKDLEMTHEFEGIGLRTVLVSGRQVDHLQNILLFLDDITERVESRAAMRASEIRYRRLFEAARDGILILDPDTRKITDANPFMSELLGYPHDELLGKELWEIGLLKDEKASRSAFRELQRKHFIRYEDLPLQNKEGQRHEVEFVSNLYDADGKYVIQCNIRDITARKQAELALRSSEERFRVLFDLGPVAVYTCDTAGRIREFNRRSVELWGRKPKSEDTDERFCGSFKLYRPDGVLIPHAQCPMAAVLEGKIPAARDVEVVIEQPGGAQINVIVNIVALKNERGQITGAINCFYDITERNRAERALLTAKDEISRHALQLEKVVAERTAELRETIGELQGFSYSVSHDMRAPLRAMQSFAQFLVDDYGSMLDEQGINYLQQIMRSAVRLDRLIQDVLSYTKILHAKLPMESVNLDALVRDLVESFPNGQPIKPEIRITGTLPRVMGNEALLAQCVSNLLSNGAKFVSPGTTPRVEVSVQNFPDGSVRLWFKDNGIGIASQNQQRIFRLFERVHADTEYEGTGIGLTIVRKATERMGAEVGVESALGQGSKFWIQLKKG